mmetsp:Transcript_14602/g.50313  ORF Transcript_14602/g.50313 Transcript_14602/m.50313 type:complete len:407 (+) Transcript_14602:1059-2279(+)
MRVLGDSKQLGLHLERGHRHVVHQPAARLQGGLEHRQVADAVLAGGEVVAVGVGVLAVVRCAERLEDKLLHARDERVRQLASDVGSEKGGNRFRSDLRVCGHRNRHDGREHLNRVRRGAEGLRRGRDARARERAVLRANVHALLDTARGPRGLAAGAVAARTARRKSEAVLPVFHAADHQELALVLVPLGSEELRGSKRVHQRALAEERNHAGRVLRQTGQRPRPGVVAVTGLAVARRHGDGAAAHGRIGPPPRARHRGGDHVAVVQAAEVLLLLLLRLARVAAAFAAGRAPRPPPGRVVVGRALARCALACGPLAAQPLARRSFGVVHDAAFALIGRPPARAFGRPRQLVRHVPDFRRHDRLPVYDGPRRHDFVLAPVLRRAAVFKRVKLQRLGRLQRSSDQMQA